MYIIQFACARMQYSGLEKPTNIEQDHDPSYFQGAGEHIHIYIYMEYTQTDSMLYMQVLLRVRRVFVLVC